jgi:hypothetical protein
VRAAVLPRDDAVSLTKQYTGPVYQVGGVSPRVPG